MEKKHCVICNNEFTPKRNTQYCSTRCKNKFYFHKRYYGDPEFRRDMIAYSMKWQENNPEKFEKIREKYGYHSINGVPKEIREAVLKRDAHSCQECGVKKEDVRLDIHHKDGSGSAFFKKGMLSEMNNTLDNLVLLCCCCHGRRHGRGHR